MSHHCSLRQHTGPNRLEEAPSSPLEDDWLPLSRRSFCRRGNVFRRLTRPGDTLRSVEGLSLQNVHRRRASSACGVAVRFIAGTLGAFLQPGLFQARTTFNKNQAIRASREQSEQALERDSAGSPREAVPRRPSLGRQLER